MYLTHSVLMARFDNDPKREDISRSENILCELLNAVNIIFSNSFRSLYGILGASFLVLISTPSCERTQENLVLKCFPWKSDFGKLASLVLQGACAMTQ